MTVEFRIDHHAIERHHVRRVDLDDVRRVVLRRTEDGGRLVVLHTGVIRRLEIDIDTLDPHTAADLAVAVDGLASIGVPVEARVIAVLAAITPGGRAPDRGGVPSTR
jgi:hypothetical protein